MKKTNFSSNWGSKLIGIIALSMFSVFVPQVAQTGYGVAVAQNNTVKGVVKDANGEPIVGASVTVKGMSVGTITDLDGNFTLNAKPGQTIVISYIGFTTQEVKADGKAINVLLNEDSSQLDEVVVLGFGIQQRKQDLSGAVTTVKDVDKIKTRSVTSSTGMLQGQVAGVQVAERSGDPTAGFSMVVRGQGSQNGDAVLWVVDGVPGAAIPSVEEIESMTVLKDAASAAIYGATSGNGGVIVVTTKQAKKTPGVRVEYDGQVNFANAVNTIHGLNAKDMLEMRRRTGNFNVSDPEEVAYMETQRCDWTDAIFRTAISNRQNVVLSTGSDVAKNRLGFSSTNKEGTLKNTFSKTLNINYKGDFDVNKWIKVTENVNWKWNRERGANTTSETSGVLINAIYSPQFAPMYEEDGSFSGWLPEKWQNDTGLMGDCYNPLRLLEGDQKWNDYTVFETHTALQIHDIIPGLKFTSRFSYWSTKYYYKNFHPYRYEVTGRQETPSSSEMYEGASTSYDWKTENTLSYDNTFGDHTISAMLSTTADKGTGRSMEAVGQSFSDESPALQYLAYANSTSVKDYFRGIDTNVAIVARLAYSYADRYFLTASWRRDYAGRLVYENNHADFPSVTAAWKISSESFWEPLKDKINLLKLRASWGRVGNINSIGWNYNSYTLSTSTNTNERPQYGITGAGTWGTQIYNNRAFNPNLTWETSEQFSIGLDAAMLNNRLNFSIDYFNKRTFNLIQEQLLNFPNYIGVGTKPQVNDGEIVNYGIELEAGWADKIGSDWGYHVRGNFTWLHNEVTKTQLNADGEWTEWAPSRSFRNLSDWERTCVGGPLGQFYLIKTDGIFQSDEEAAAYVDKNGNRIQPNAKAGDLKFIDFNGDGQITNDDKQYCGSATPKTTFALTAGFNWKKLSVDCMFQGVGGAQVLYVGKTMIYNDNEGNFNRAEGIKDSWGWGKTTDATIPRLAKSDDNGNFSKMSDWFLEDGSYLRMKSFTVSYDLTSLLRKVGHFAERGSMLSAYITGENLFTLTKYSGMDPECGGLDTVKYPVSRTISFGVKVTY